jgi:hypothetical protein
VTAFSNLHRSWKQERLDSTGRQIVHTVAIFSHEVFVWSELEDRGPGGFAIGGLHSYDPVGIAVVALGILLLAALALTL